MQCLSNVLVFFQISLPFFLILSISPLLHCETVPLALNIASLGAISPPLRMTDLNNKILMNRCAWFSFEAIKTLNEGLSKTIT